jgi:hypothetical protein
MKKYDICEPQCDNEHLRDITFIGEDIQCVDREGRPVGIRKAILSQCMRCKIIQVI